MSDDKLNVDVTGGDLNRHADDTWGALMARNDPRHPEVSLRGDLLCRLARDESDVQLQPYTGAALRDRMSGVIRFVVETEKGSKEVKPPTDVTSVILDRTPDQLEPVPRINRVTDVPVFGSDESLDTQPGYHAGSRTYYQPFGSLLADLPDWRDSEELYFRPEDVQAATDLLVTELLGDFPFADKASRSHALCLILEPFVRELIGDHPTPLYVVIAPTHGLGKSKLARACLLPGCGAVSESPPPSSDENEFRKRLTADLMTGPAAIWFDNVSQPLDSAALAAALTATRWSDRRIGHSQMVNVPIRNVWIATMNNPTISTELTRRAVPIFLDAGVPEPWMRTGPEPGKEWRHADLMRWAMESREDLVHAALILVKNYLRGQATLELPMLSLGRSAGSRFFGSYERWSEVMGGIIAASGGSEFLANRERLHSEADSTREDDAAFLEEWHARSRDPMTAAQVVSMIKGASGIPGLDAQPITTLPRKLLVRKDDLPKELASWLQWNKDAIIGGHVLKNDGKRPRRWYVDKVF